MLGQRRNPLLDEVKTTSRTPQPPCPQPVKEAAPPPPLEVMMPPPAAETPFAAAPEPVQQPELSEEQICRTGDTRLGSRVYVPPADLPVCAVPEEEQTQADDAPDAESSPHCDLGVLERVRRALTGVLLIVVGVLGCYLTGQVASFCESLRSLSTQELSILGTLMAVFVGVLVFVLFNLVRLLFQLRTFTQISGRSLRELDERQQLQRHVVARNQAARERLTELLNDEPERQYLTWRRLAGLEKAGYLRRVRLELVECHCASDEWMNRYLQQWQSEVDKLVKARIRYYSWRAAGLATLSPFPLVDQLIVLGTCMVLLKELMQLYNLKAGWDRNLLLLGRAVMHVYVAGIWQPLMEQGAEQGAEMLTELLSEEGAHGLLESAVGQTLAKHGLRLLGEGVMHKLSVGRFGYAAMRALRPVNPDK